VPKRIVSDRGTQFTPRFWEKLHESIDTKLNFSSAYHPQTEGPIRRLEEGGRGEWEPIKNLLEGD
jgi:transposase InsO family protein